jgi:hypothetical protein
VREGGRERGEGIAARRSKREVSERGRQRNEFQRLVKTTARCEVGERGREHEMEGWGDRGNGRRRERKEGLIEVEAKIEVGN